MVKMLVHVVFSTTDRVNFITPEIEDPLFAYISGIVKNNNARLLIGYGTTNHVHLLLSIRHSEVGELIG